jgi:hypothetical protein
MMTREEESNEEEEQGDDENPRNICRMGYQIRVVAFLKPGNDADPHFSKFDIRISPDHTQLLGDTVLDTPLREQHVNSFLHAENPHETEGEEHMLRRYLTIELDIRKKPFQ